MYQCIQCEMRTEMPALVYDEYDNDIYRKCAYCGGSLEKQDVTCKSCGNIIFSGEKAIEIGDDIYCKNCTAEVIV